MLLCGDAQTRSRFQLMKIFKLCTDADASVVLRTNIPYFRTHFIGNPMAQSWRSPPITVLNKSKKVLDFTSWMLSAPAVSERAKSALGNCVGGQAEFLPLIRVKGVQIYAMNVLNTVDCLDIAKSQIVFDPSEP